MRKRRTHSPPRLRPPNSRASEPRCPGTWCCLIHALLSAFSSAFAFAFAARFVTKILLLSALTSALAFLLWHWCFGRTTRAGPILASGSVIGCLAVTPDEAAAWYVANVASSAASFAWRASGFAWSFSCYLAMNVPTPPFAVWRQRTALLAASVQLPTTPNALRYIR